MSEIVETTSQIAIGTPFPEERVNYNHPFQPVGVDLTGAYNLVETDVDNSTHVRHKGYVCLFTCAATRAIHLELLRDLTTMEFVYVLRRFISCHSIPSLVISGHGTNFVDTDNFLKTVFEEPEVKAYLDNNQIKWKFITARAPWQGGFYERLIGVVKRALNAAISNRKLSFVEVQTVLCEIKTIIDSRPLTYVSENLEDSHLTPNQLLYDRNIVLAPPLNEFIDNDVPFCEDVDLRLQYTQLSSALKRFQSAFVKDYLTSLRERHYGNKVPELENRPLQVGDIVLVDLESHRNLWPVGRVTQLYEGRGGKLRSVQVKIRDKLYERPINKIVHLELGTIDCGAAVADEINDCSEPLPAPTEPPKGRPVRATARKAAEVRKDLISQGQL